MKYQSSDREDKKKESLEKEEEGKECKSCHYLNELEAMFCANCGADLREQKKCPKCGAKIISPNADICEVCGEWLLEGKCKFCYADLEEGATFCAECGNPVAGIVCPECGKLSYFDFCKFCNAPLTNVAHKMIEKVKNNPQEEVEIFSTNQEARAYFMAQKYIIISQKVEVIEMNKDNELLKLKDYMEKVEKKGRMVYKPIFSDKQRESINAAGKSAEKEIERQEEERRRREEEERRRQEEERRRQEEERRKREEEKRRGAKGWVCNAYGAFHSDGPCGCADPSKGGHWVY